MLEEVAIIPDVHAPFHDKKAVDLTLKALSSFKPKTTVIMGDFADFFSVSFHSKDPARSGRLADELESVNGLLDRFDALGSKRKVYVCGNHEQRLDRYLADKAPALHGLPSTSVQALLCLKKRGWEFVPYRQSIRIGKVNFTHDVGQSGATAYVGAGKAFEASAVIGHVHRIGLHYFGNARGDGHVSASFGWLGDKSKVDYLHAITAKKEWQHGFGIGFLERNGTMHLGACPIVNGKVVVAGKLYS